MFTLDGNIATVVAVATIQGELGVLLVLEGAVLGAVRGFLDTTAKQHSGFRIAALELATRTQAHSLTDSIPALLRVIVRSAFIVVLLVGLMNSIVEVLIALAGVAAVMTVASLVLPRLPGYTNLMMKIPIVVRLIVGLLIGGVLGYLIISTFYTLTASLLPVLAAALISIAAVLVLAPEQAASIALARPNAPGR